MANRNPFYKFVDILLKYVVYITEFTYEIINEKYFTNCIQNVDLHFTLSQIPVSKCHRSLYNSIFV
jgi:hypothetical protein